MSVERVEINVYPNYFSNVKSVGARITVQDMDHGDYVSVGGSEEDSTRELQCLQYALPVIQSRIEELTGGK